MEQTTEARLTAPVTVECAGCSLQLEMPYIRCAECSQPAVDICLQCFARGLQTGQHCSEHCYQVIRNDFPLFEPTWTAEHELKFLDTLLAYGADNWSAISREMRTKTTADCEHHYSKFYLEQRVPEMPLMKATDVVCQSAPIVYKLCDDPPRLPDASMAQLDMAGYQAARADFTVTHDNYAELHLLEISFEDQEESDTDREFYRALNFAVIQVYQNALKERRRRTRIIRKYGLINTRKLAMRHQMYASLDPNSLDATRSLQRLLPPIEFDKFTESLHYESGLRQKILALQDYRTSGLTKLQLVGVYTVMRDRRMTERHRHTLFSEALYNREVDHTFNALMLASDASDRARLPNLMRKTAPPLNILSLPGYDRLSNEERPLCSEVRLVPEAFLEFKRLLVTECQRSGGLRLAQARPLIKIDVNKTRKIYNYLLQRGDIHVH